MSGCTSASALPWLSSASWCAGRAAAPRAGRASLRTAPSSCGRGRAPPGGDPCREGIDGMRIGLYTITYLGIWYRGEPLRLEDIMRRARAQGWEGIELDTKRPHASPMDLSRADRARLRDLAGELALPLCAVSPHCDLSSPVPDQREAMPCYARA